MVSLTGSFDSPENGVAGFPYAFPKTSFRLFPPRRTTLVSLTTRLAVLARTCVKLKPPAKARARAVCQA